MKSEPLKALVLHRRPYRETSFLVDFFTQEQGKVSAMCKGVRGGKSSRQSERKSLLQPFQLLNVNFSGRHELKTLTFVESHQHSYSLSGSALFSAFYLNELLNRVLPKEVALPEIFQLYAASLLRLSENQPIEPVLREFELQMLVQLGYGFDWQLEGNTGEALVPEQYYTFILEVGFVHDPLPNHTQNRFIGQALLDVDNREWNNRALGVAKRVMRMALAPVLGDKPLKSRELFLSMEKTT